MTRTGSVWRRGFVLAASLALAGSAAPAAVVAQDERAASISCTTSVDARRGRRWRRSSRSSPPRRATPSTFGEIDHENYKTGHPRPARRQAIRLMRTDRLGRRPRRFQGRERGAHAHRRDVGRERPRRAFPAGMVDAAVHLRRRQVHCPVRLSHAGMFYNPKVLDDGRRRAIPTTWDELMARLRDLQEQRHLPISLGASNRWPAQFWFDYLLLRTAGPEYRAKLMAGEACLHRPGGRASDGPSGRSASTRLFR